MEAFTTILVPILFLIITNVHVHAALFTGLGDLPGGPDGSEARDISSDGNVVVGYSVVDSYEHRTGVEIPVWEAFRWTMDTGMQSLGTLPNRQQSFAFGVSADGSVIVGENQVIPIRHRYSAFRWTEKERMVEIAPLGSSGCTEFGSGQAAVSDDGTNIVGWSYDPSIPGW